jgi:hypothetical protein
MKTTILNWVILVSPASWPMIWIEKGKHVEHQTILRLKLSLVLGIVSHLMYGQLE